MFLLAAVSPARTKASVNSCVLSAGSWMNVPVQQQTGTFRLTYTASASAANVDGVTGLSSGPANEFSDLAAVIRFNSNGTIDAMNGSAYTAASTIRYSSGVNYRFIMYVDFSSHTYNAYVMIGTVIKTIGTNLAFRTAQSHVGTLNNVAAMTAPGTTNVCNITLSTIRDSAGHHHSADQPRSYRRSDRQLFDRHHGNGAVDLPMDEERRSDQRRELFELFDAGNDHRGQWHTLHRFGLQQRRNGHQQHRDSDGYVCGCGSVNLRAASWPHGNRRSDFQLLGDRIGNRNVDLPVDEEWRSDQRRERSQLHHSGNQDYRQRLTIRRDRHQRLGQRLQQLSDADRNRSGCGSFDLYPAG